MSLHFLFYEFWIFLRASIDIVIDTSAVVVYLKFPSIRFIDRSVSKNVKLIKIEKNKKVQQKKRRRKKGYVV